MSSSKLSAFTLAVVLGKACAASTPDTLKFHSEDAYGSFTNICEHPESGDLIGINLLILRGGSGSFSLFQEAEGTLADPVLAKIKFVTPNGKDMEFEPEELGSSPFDRLTYNSDQLRIRWANGRIGTRGEKVDVLHRSFHIPSARLAPKCVE
jgi:hypothetical protein